MIVKDVSADLLLLLLSQEHRDFFNRNIDY